MTSASVLPSDPVNPEISIDVRGDYWNALDVDVMPLCRKAAEQALAGQPGMSGGVEISIVLADDAFVRDLNKTWRNIDNPTNVLAFPCSNGEDSVEPDAETLLGDVIVAFQTTQREAVDLSLSFDDHFAHLIVHGVLHLLGYDHIDDDDAVVMEKLEVEALSRMGIGNPYKVGH